MAQNPIENIRQRVGVKPGRKRNPLQNAAQRRLLRGRENAMTRGQGQKIGLKRQMTEGPRVKKNPDRVKPPLPKTRVTGNTPPPPPVAVPEGQEVPTSPGRLGNTKFQAALKERRRGR